MTEVEPAGLFEERRTSRARYVRNRALVLVLIGFAVLLYAMTVVKLLG